MRLPAEQQALLTTLLPQLRHVANSVHWKFFMGSNDLYTREDLVQVTLARLYTALNFPPPDEDQLMRWANVAMRNAALDAIVKARRERGLGRGYVQEQEYHALGPYEAEEKVSYLLRMAGQHLRPVVNQVLIGYSQGHSGKQIAQELRIPHATVRTHFQTAKRRLRELGLTAANC